MDDKKRLLCKLGWHSWYRDCALIHSVERCNECPAVASERDAREVLAERTRLAALPPGATIGDMYWAALNVPRPRPRSRHMTITATEFTAARR